VAGVRVICLGILRVEINGQPIHRFDTDKSRALFIYLAIENKNPQPRSHLAGLLWSDQSEEQANHNLRQTLSSLRKTFGDPVSSHPILLVERDSVQLNPANSLWVDVLAFRAGLTTAFQHYQRRDQGGWLNIRRLSAALLLRHGPFLDHFFLKGSPLFDEWLTLIREEIDQRAVEGLSLLSEIHERRGEYTLARQTAQRIIEIAPWDEAAHEQLMRLFALDRQWGAVLNQYQSLRRILQENLGIEPARETNQLFERIRARQDHLTESLLRFPPDRSNLPVSPTPFLGRETELDEITDLLVDPGCRLLTLLGPGGIGKTRLALEVARQQIGVFYDGAFFVPLLAVSKGDQVYSAIADALRLVPSELTDLQAHLINYLRDKRLILVLDNFEQLIGSAASTSPLEKILSQATGVIFLVTSRERLMLQEEWIYPVSGLRYPQSVSPINSLPTQELLDGYDALDLFYRRARQARHNFDLDEAALPAMIRICQLLEGLPLGIELAAAAVWDQSCAAIAEKISASIDSFSAVASNVPVSQRSLWATFDVSWQRLTSPEQALFCRLAVFRAGFTLEAAQQATQATPELLTALVNQSLLNLDLNGRYHLHEVVRQYAEEKLTFTGCLDETRTAHANFYSAFFANQYAPMGGHEQKKVLEIIQLEIHNAELAWEWSCHTGQIENLMSCMDAIYQFFNIRSHFSPGIALFLTAIPVLEHRLAEEPCQTVETALGMVLARVGSLAHYARQNSLALENLERSQEFFARLDLPSELAFCRATLGGVYLRAKNFSNAQICAQQNLAYSHQTDNALGENRALYLLGLIQDRLGKYAEAKQFLHAALNAGRLLQDQRRLTAPLNLLGDIACAEGNYPEAEALFVESLTISRDLEDLFYQAIVLNNLGKLAVAQGEFAQAISFSEQALRIAQQIDEEWTIVVCLNNLGEALCGMGKYDQAMKYLVKAIRIAWEIEAIDPVARFAVNAGRCRQLQGCRQDAVDLYTSALAHPAIEHDAREKASRWLLELNAEARVGDLAPSLETVIARIIL
jgi:predicted ATPase/DNA-binding SARP family transcriptional activator/Tfp pilus assembly protein PilF